MVELSDGTIRALDGNGNVEIEVMRDAYDVDFNMFYNPKFLKEQRTRVTVDMVGTWTMYQGAYPQKPEEAQEIEERKQLEQAYEPQPGDANFEW